jgi:hypothetical protein
MERQETPSQQNLAAQASPYIPILSFYIFPDTTNKRRHQPTIYYTRYIIARMQHFSADAETDLFHSSVHPSIQQPTLPVLPRFHPCTYRHQQTPPRQELYISIGSFLFFGEKSTAITKESELFRSEISMHAS